jgi:CMP-N-acetylneuraminic acid synthetase/quercetin dioxygenase-like cupin family protein
MKKVVAMIPARLGSKRVPKKNLRLLNGKPLIAYCIETAKKSGVFDEIYINSEAEIFRDIASDYDIRFYKRAEALSSDQTINDEFAYDFIKNVACDVLVQFLPTSPLITEEEVREFVKRMLDTGFDTLVSVINHQIACVYRDEPINFAYSEAHRSSQEMVPVQSYATVLMAWDKKSFIKNMQDHGCAYHGAAAKTGYFEINGLSTIDIDKEEDFQMAEVALQYRESQPRQQKLYYQREKEMRQEVSVPEILKLDGVWDSDFSRENMPLVNLDKILAEKDNTRSWCLRIVNTENNSATLISQLPGEGNRLHFHPNWNEWWYIVKGKWKWEIEGKEYIVSTGDVVFIEKNKVHKITAIGDEPAVRLAVSRENVPHIYPGDPTCVGER